MLSGRKIALLFLLTSLGAGLAHVTVQAMFPGIGGDNLVGASGGIIGMLLAYFSLSPQSRMMFLPVSARNLAKGVLISSALLTVVNPGLGLPWLSDFGSSLAGLLGEGVFRVAHLAHFAGGLLGWVFVDRFFPKLLTRGDLARMRSDNELASELLSDG